MFRRDQSWQGKRFIDTTGWGMSVSCHVVVVVLFTYFFILIFFIIIILFKWQKTSKRKQYTKWGLLCCRGALKSQIITVTWRCSASNSEELNIYLKTKSYTQQTKNVTITKVDKNYTSFSMKYVLNLDLKVDQLTMSNASLDEIDDHSTGKWTRQFSYEFNFGVMFSLKVRDLTHYLQK